MITCELPRDFPPPTTPSPLGGGNWQGLQLLQVTITGFPHGTEGLGVEHTQGPLRRPSGGAHVDTSTGQGQANGSKQEVVV